MYDTRIQTLDRVTTGASRSRTVSAPECSWTARFPTRVRVSTASETGSAIPLPCRSFTWCGRRAQQKKLYLIFFKFKKLILFGTLDFILHVCFFSKILWQPKNLLYSAVVFHFHVWEEHINLMILLRYYILTFWPFVTFSLLFYHIVPG